MDSSKRETEASEKRKKPNWLCATGFASVCADVTGTLHWQSQWHPAHVALSQELES